MSRVSKFRIILAVACIAVLSVAGSAFAVDVNSWEGLRTAVNNGGAIKITASFDVTTLAGGTSVDPIILGTKPVSIDGGGFAIDGKVLPINSVGTGAGSAGGLFVISGDKGVVINNMTIKDAGLSSVPGKGNMACYITISGTDYINTEIEDVNFETTTALPVADATATFVSIVGRLKNDTTLSDYYIVEMEDCTFTKKGTGVNYTGVYITDVNRVGDRVEIKESKFTGSESSTGNLSAPFVVENSGAGDSVIMLKENEINGDFHAGIRVINNGAARALNLKGNIFNIKAVSGVATSGIGIGIDGSSQMNVYALNNTVNSAGDAVKAGFTNAVVIPPVAVNGITDSTKWTNALKRGFSVVLKDVKKTINVAQTSQLAYTVNVSGDMVAKDVSLDWTSSHILVALVAPKTGEVTGISVGSSDITLVSNYAVHKDVDNFQLDHSEVTVTSARHPSSSGGCSALALAPLALLVLAPLAVRKLRK